MPAEEPANIYALYEFKVRESNKTGRPNAKYIEQISEYLTRDKKIKLTALEITKYANDKKSWNKMIAEPKKFAR